LTRAKRESILVIITFVAAAILAWIRQTAQSWASSSIHELSLWRYDAAGGIR